MLNQLTINNYAIVDHLDLDLEAGMTAISGETGAGKSIMLDALGLTLGDRADKDVIKEGADRADITASFAIEKNKPALKWLKNHDLDDQELCLLRRVISRDGRSKAYINGQPTTLNNLKELGEMLIDIHSQHEHQSLLKTATHQRLLDDFCQTQPLAAEVEEIAGQWRQVNNTLQSIKQQSEESDARYQLLSYQVKELEDLALQEGENKALEEEHKRLSSSEESLTILQQTLQICSEDDQFNLQHGLNQAVSLLQNLPYSGESEQTATELLNTALIQVEEAMLALKKALDSSELDPERLAEIDQRLGVIHQLARKHRVNPDELAKLHNSLQQELSGLSRSDEEIARLEKELATLLQQFQDKAGELSKKRSEGAAKLEKKVNSQLAFLGMQNAHCKLALNTRPTDIPLNKGFEDIEFLVSTNPGQPAKPLIKIASGGELSRISLAIQVVTANTSNIPSMVFDEVDVGIGGGVAKSVGQLLRQLGEKGQILCVTHQPQVASQGHQHLFVAKNTESGTTATRLFKLNKKERIAEIARMLDGEAHTEKSLAHAREMMAG